MVPLAPRTAPPALPRPLVLGAGGGVTDGGVACTVGVAHRGAGGSGGVSSGMSLYERRGMTKPLLLIDKPGLRSGGKTLKLKQLACL